MLDEIYAFVMAYRELVSIVVLTILLVILLLNWWDEVKLFAKSTFYSMPLIGKTRRLSKDLNVRRDGWFASERTLCEDFAGDIRKIAADPDMYDKAKSYLGKVQELGRTELGIAMRLLLIAMVFIEALGFAYVLSGYTLPGASEKLQVQGAFGIAFLISCVLVFFTHQAGHELHKRGLIGKIRTWWNHDSNPDRPNLMGRTNKTTLENDDLDDHDPAYLQILHRLDTNATVTKGTPIWTIVAVIAIIGVACTATYVRYETYKQEKTAETTGAPAPDNSFSLGDLMSNDDALPDLLAQPQQSADAKASKEREGARDAANLSTYAILAALFILIQIMGIGIGFKTGFAGKESSEARRIIGKFSSRAGYESWFERKRDAIARIAQKHLTNLQSRLTDHAATTGVDKAHRDILQYSADRNFMEHYYQSEDKSYRARQASEAVTRNMEMQHRDAAVAASAAASGPAPAPVATPEPEALSQPAETTEQMEQRLRAKIKQEIAEKKAREEAEKQAKPAESEEEMYARMRREEGLED
ncbi:hypothetical protein [Thalassospira mesophila]|uniref:Uncharacterized protein n=1 Tax=Thalassospira mesophila TaxID=1293891 RepID=A0A1Y2L4Q0_9PROT|nr:hypothetical protein [Thalassospira mesophila]OSQ40651.1 hypothetical protein TMES_02685 [Thalassospira mesophila]